MRSVLSHLSPGVRWALLGLAAVAALALAAHGWTRLWAWAPWSVPARLERSQAELRETRARLEAAQAAATAHAEARAIQTRAEAAQQALVEAGRRQGAAVDRLTQTVLDEIRRPDDALDPINPARFDRLRDHDRGLCRAAPHLDGCAAASDGARDGAAAVRPDGAAG